MVCCSHCKRCKNPIRLAREILTQTEHNYLGGEGAVHVARQAGLPVEPIDYFITEHQLRGYEDALKKARGQQALMGHAASHGTVGAVACDHFGNTAAATSTGGTHFSMRGRMADSSAVGAGGYTPTMKPVQHNPCSGCQGKGDHHAFMALVVDVNISAQEIGSFQYLSITARYG